jgi:hypothetical protein
MLPFTHNKQNEEAKSHNFICSPQSSASAQPMQSNQPPEEGVSDAAFAAKVARLAEILGPGFVCQDQSQFIEDLVRFMHYGTPLPIYGAENTDNEGLRLFHESSLDGTDTSGVFHIEDAYEVAFKHKYQTRDIQFGADLPPPPPMFGRNAQMQNVEPLVMRMEDYEEDEDPSAVDLSKRAPLISHTELRNGMVQTWAGDVLMTHPRMAAATATLPHYPTFLDALAVMRDATSHTADVAAPVGIVVAAENAPSSISDESLVCLAKKAGAMCLHRATYDTIRQCAEEYVGRMCQHLTAAGSPVNTVASAQSVQEALIATDQLTVLGYGYKGLVNRCLM